MSKLTDYRSDSFPPASQDHLAECSAGIRDTIVLAKGPGFEQASNPILSTSPTWHIFPVLQSSRHGVPFEYAFAFDRNSFAESLHVQTRASRPSIRIKPVRTFDPTLLSTIHQLLGGATYTHTPRHATRRHTPAHKSFPLPLTPILFPSAFNFCTCLTTSSLLICCPKFCDSQIIVIMCSPSPLGPRGAFPAHVSGCFSLLFRRGAVMSWTQCHGCADLVKDVHGLRSTMTSVSFQGAQAH